jgi:thymidylate synthase ThyX
MESTRYVNYSKGNKKTSSVIFASTHWFADKPENLKQKLIEFWELAENYYNFFIENGLKPEDARESLPLSIRTRLVQCGYHKAWNNFFHLRCDPAAHPNAQAIAKKLKALFKAEEKFY